MHGIVVMGADGMLGRAWCELLRQRGIPFEALRRPSFDLSRTGSVADVVHKGHELVINCAAYTDVDAAENDEPRALHVNGTAVGELAERCARVGAMIVHYSTDYVFDGRANRPYGRTTPQSPVNAYGRSKAWGEQLLRASRCAHLLVRTSWLYAPWGKNFVGSMRRLVRERSRLRVVHDQRGRPTSAEHLARTTMALVEHGERGAHHVSDGGECTWFELAGYVARSLGAGCEVEPCTTEEFPRPARRPAYGVLDIAETEAVVGPFPHWTDNVRSVLERYA